MTKNWPTVYFILICQGIYLFLDENVVGQNNQQLIKNSKWPTFNSNLPAFGQKDPCPIPNRTDVKPSLVNWSMLIMELVKNYKFLYFFSLFFKFNSWKWKKIYYWIKFHYQIGYKWPINDQKVTNCLFIWL